MKRVNFIFRAVLVAAMFMGTLVVNAAGDFKAYEFKTGNTGITCGALGFTEKSLTVELWLNLDSEDGLKNVVVMATSKTMEGKNHGFMVNFRENSEDNNEIYLRLFAKDATDANAHFYVPREHFIGKWGHVAYVISEADQKAYAYVNGELFGEKDITGGWMGNSDEALKLGHWWSDPKPYGKIADVRIWNVARTAEEINENYNKNLEGENTGLFLNYTFSTFERGLVNAANPDDNTNKGWCNPETDWQSFYASSTLSKMPVNIVVSEDDITWDTNEGVWEVEILDKETSESVYFVDELATNTVAFSDVTGLVNDKEYTVKIRTLNNNFYSGWATLDFTYGQSSVGIGEVAVDELKFAVNNGTLLIYAATEQEVNIYNIDGRLVRSVNVEAGTNAVNGLTNGLYIVNKRKLIIK